MISICTAKSRSYAVLLSKSLLAALLLMQLHACGVSRGSTRPSLPAASPISPIGSVESTTFAWTAVPGASSYRVVVKPTTATNAPILLDQTVNGTILATTPEMFATPLLNGTTYYWYVRPDNGRWSEATRFVPTLPDAPEALSIVSNARQQIAGTAEILVWAEGNTVEAARNNAFRQAVERVTGVYIDAQTLVRNQQVVEDAILRLANGFVEGYDVLQEQQRNSLIYGQYRVRVRIEPLVGALSAKLGEQMVLDVGDISAAVSSQMERNRQILAAISQMLSEHPRKSVSLVPVGFGLAREVGINETVEAYVDVAVQWQQAWLYRFSRLLEKAETPSTPVAFCWLNSFNDPVSLYRQYGNPAMFNTSAAFNINVQNVHLPAAVRDELFSRMVRSDGVPAYSDKPRCPILKNFAG